MGKPSPSKVTERQFQQDVIAFAHLKQWFVAHFYTARVRDAWVTPAAADGIGFPDLVLTRDRVVYVELKSSRGRVSPHQQRWIERLREAGSEVHVWRPTDWAEIQQVLA